MPINDPEEFPGVAEFDHTAPHFEVSPDSFRSGLKLVALATESEESRYALGSVMIDHDESSMYLIATDGRRMARFEFPCSNIGEHVPQSQVLIRDAQLVRLSRAMSHHDGVHQFVQERAVYLADLVERIAAAMDGAAT